MDKRNIPSFDAMPSGDSSNGESDSDNISSLQSPEVTIEIVLSHHILELLTEFFRDYPNFDITTAAARSVKAVKDQLRQICGKDEIQSVDAKMHLKQVILNFDWVGSLNSLIDREYAHIVHEFENISLEEICHRIDNYVQRALPALETAIRMTKYYSAMLLGNADYLTIDVSGIMNQVRLHGNQIKERMKKLKIQHKFNKGVEPPNIKQVSYLKYKKVRRPYTEWKNFSIEDDLEQNLRPTCWNNPFMSFLCPFLTSKITDKIWYYAPKDWEIANAKAQILDGDYLKGRVVEVKKKENLAMADVEISHKTYNKKPAWAKVKLEGTITRLRVQDVEVPQEKKKWVIVDKDGVEHDVLEPPEDEDKKKA